MNSEVWVASLEKERCLPFVLAEKGFDVWVNFNCLDRSNLKSIVPDLSIHSVEITEATNIQRNPFITLLPQPNFGISAWMSLRSMISLTL
jgi:hypothetical protein